MNLRGKTAKGLYEKGEPRWSVAAPHPDDISEVRLREQGGKFFEMYQLYDGSYAADEISERRARELAKSRLQALLDATESNNSTLDRAGDVLRECARNAAALALAVRVELEKARGGAEPKQGGA